MTRRGFLARLLRSLVAGSATPAALRAGALALETGKVPSQGSLLSATQWRTVAAVQEHLLPSEPGIPGAREIHATGYLRLVLTDPRLDDADREFIRSGVVELDEVCGSLYAKTFTALEVEQREAALRKLETSRSGRRWLAEMLEFVLEALLGDPSHGGNPNGIGWQWLGVTPGFPRPPLRVRGPLVLESRNSVTYCRNLP